MQVVAAFMGLIKKSHLVKKTLQINHYSFMLQQKKLMS